VPQKRLDNCCVSGCTVNNLLFFCVQSLEGLKDGDSAHFECTLIPVGDPNLKVEWFHNGQPIRHSSRMKSVSDFGFVVMDISYLQSHDSGEYVCRASNRYCIYIGWWISVEHSSIAIYCICCTVCTGNMFRPS
jgi:hypothetical protein